MAKSYEIRVKIVEVGETEEVGKNKLKKREVIGMIEGEYPDFYKFEFIKDRVDLCDELIEGTYATIFFNLNGRRVESKKQSEKGQYNYFSSLQAWKIDVG